MFVGVNPLNIPICIACYQQIEAQDKMDAIS